MTAYGERIARVEVEVQALKQSLEEHKAETARNFQEVKDRFTTQDKKLDELLALRNKGAGVLWLIGGVVSTGLMGVVVEIVNWLKG